MSRNPYSTRDLVDEQLEPIEVGNDNAKTVVAVGRALVAAVCVLARAVGDVADATRKPTP